MYLVSSSLSEGKEEHEEDIQEDDAVSRVWPKVQSFCSCLRTLLKVVLCSETNGTLLKMVRCN